MLGLVSRLGNGVFWYTLMLVILASGNDEAVPAFTRMAAVGLIGVLLYKWLKKTTSRPRPCARNGRIVARVAPLDEFSFPSGHTLHAVAFTIVATAYFPWLALLLVPFTLLVALSRVVLGLHYPSDVLAGALLGTALATGVLLW
ncbi:phosphatase PAP2 family protein [Corticibacter populi]|uniref:Phosphatase PAP2 family protein n=2 Tax=Corticibacter populi TaxID=1550736 RepID=A0A3M6QHR3_9BURK|nr:phosphatase PAP2 family protein [Corticibacter populi]